jgi:hypothetical protein
MQAPAAHSSDGMQHRTASSSYCVISAVQRKHIGVVVTVAVAVIIITASGQPQQPVASVGRRALLESRARLLLGGAGGGQPAPLTSRFKFMIELDRALFARPAGATTTRRDRRRQFSGDLLVRSAVLLAGVLCSCCCYSIRAAQPLVAGWPKRACD